MRNALSILLLLALLCMPVLPVFGHCQIPCGIFDDQTRFAIMLEDVETIEKSMKQIQNISAQEIPNWNQLVRWVNNKEEHADKLTEIVTYYFLAQRIKPAPAGDEKAQAKYVRHLTLLHQIMVHAMKAKHGTDLEHVEALRKLIGEFKTSYLDHDH